MSASDELIEKKIQQIISDTERQYKEFENIQAGFQGLQQDMLRAGLPNQLSLTPAEQAELDRQLAQFNQQLDSELAQQKEYSIGSGSRTSIKRRPRGIKI
ncbi:hypothetical protein H0A36_09805 [Endozoicomonas sp. SM1973]|uniref:VPS28 C-terminal domain-containing protein n=1 Tax=Spartinivicinus marinus TaxID=2994442 RepID=A0A853I894_9GAMM|nr:hypothetical protein [Spartinivicinus marinus]MCX4024669.1 hypothetical protein [Spartinivicinus marinus]NYZ66304.1 hypothetical protein [Spartinivicinus marinus]